MEANNQQQGPTISAQWGRSYVTVRLTKGRVKRLRQVAALYNRESGPKEAIDLAVDIALNASSADGESTAQSELAERMDRMEARMDRMQPRIEQIAVEVGSCARSMRDLQELIRTVAAGEEPPPEEDPHAVIDLGVWLERRLAESSPSLPVNVARLEATFESRRQVGSETEIVMAVRLLSAQGRKVDAELPTVRVLTVRSGRGPFNLIKLGERVALDCHRQTEAWRLVASRKNAASGRWDDPCGEHPHKVRR